MTPSISVGPASCSRVHASGPAPNILPEVTTLAEVQSIHKLRFLRNLRLGNMNTKTRMGILYANHIPLIRSSFHHTHSRHPTPRFVVHGPLRIIAGPRVSR